MNIEDVDFEDLAEYLLDSCEIHHGMVGVYMALASYLGSSPDNSEKVLTVLEELKLFDCEPYFESDNRNLEKAIDDNAFLRK